MLMFKNAGSSPYIARVLTAVLRFMYSIPVLNSSLRKASDILSYLEWLEQNFGKVKIASSRESVWTSIYKQFQINQKVVGIELGVAHGYMTKFWLSNLDKNICEWHGFDSFEGLPKRWRQYEVGTFSNGGIPPKISDTRLVWHVGSVENTIPAFLSIQRRLDCTWLILFDLDLFEPTLDSWKHLEQHVMPGDYLYFDEAFDEGELKVIRELILPYFETSFVAASSGSLAIRIENRKVR
jgi:hypothetical protein